jgi:phosphopantetheinyl transferase
VQWFEPVQPAPHRAEQTKAANQLLPHPICASSISHSKNWLAAAWTARQGAEIGIDIEAIRPMGWLTDPYVLAGVLHPKERVWVDAGTAIERIQRGLISWCRKEALLKAMGIGLKSGFSLNEIGHTAHGVLYALPKQLGTVVAMNWQTHSEWIGTDNRQAAVAVAWRLV